MNQPLRDEMKMASKWARKDRGWKVTETPASACLKPLVSHGLRSAGDGKSPPKRHLADSEIKGNQVCCCGASPSPA